MIIALIIVLVLLLLGALYILALRGRSRHRLMRKLRCWSYAHRGLHGDGIPENSMTAFRLALEHGYGIELDVHLLADGNLAVIHDSSLLRTAGADVEIETLTTQQLKNFFLQGTMETIPTLQEVLELFDGKAPLIIELKSKSGNHDALTQTVCEMLAQYQGLYCLESFDPRCIRWLKKHRPRLVRGQLAHNSLHEKSEEVPFYFRFAMTNLFSNFWNVPDFIAYKFDDRNRFNLRLIRKIWHVQCVAWTLRSKEDYDTAVKEDWIPIFEGFEPNQKTPE